MGEADWTQTSVTREWYHEVEIHGERQRGRLDILLENGEEKFLCAIENKVFSGEHSGQLGRYKRALDENYPEDFTKRYVFLSPNGMSPGTGRRSRTLGTGGVRRHTWNWWRTPLTMEKSLIGAKTFAYSCGNTQQRYGGTSCINNSDDMRQTGSQNLRGKPGGH